MTLKRRIALNAVLTLGVFAAPVSSLLTGAEPVTPLPWLWLWCVVAYAALNGTLAAACWLVWRRYGRVL